MNDTMWCWWCCHPSNQELLPMPHKYDGKSNVYHTMGQFCSFACMRAYNGERNDYIKQSVFNLISKYELDSTGMLYNVIAPPRCCLKVFGGDMTIEDFRNNNQSVKIYDPPCVPITRTIDKNKTTNYRWIQNSSNDVESKCNINQLQSAKACNIPMKIKTSSDAPAKRTIEQVLGIKQKPST